jgi:CHASE2 domain-containing sensor protein
MQLIVAALMLEGPAGPRRIGDWLAGPSDHTRHTTVGDLRISAREDDLAQRILYTIPWRLANRDDVRPLVPWRDGIAAPILETVPAGAVAEGRADTSALRDRVVVIGGSFADARDLYATPLGEMPGAIVLVNSIESLIQYGQLSPAPGWLRWILLVAMLFGMGAVSAKVEHFWGLVISGGLIIAALIPLSLHLLHYGRWLDFALPLLGALLDNLAAQGQDAVAREHS